MFPKKILMLTTKFCHADGSPWLPSELAAEFLKRGCEVTVINLEWSGSAAFANIADSGRFVYHAFNAYRMKDRKAGVAVRWLFSSFKLLPTLLKQCIFHRKYDLLIAFSPCTALYASLPLATTMCRKSFLVYWDFFPIHNQQISGVAPFLAQPFFKHLEAALIRRFTTVGLMSRACSDFFDSYFGLHYLKKDICPIWTSVLENQHFADVRLRYSLDQRSVVFVFGGQLVEGRSIVEVCEAVILASAVRTDIALVVCGAGSLASTVEQYADRFPLLIKYLGALSRNDYLAVLNSADVGIVSTQAGVSAPAYPSKCLDYMASGLPIMAAVDSVSDFGKIIVENGLGVSCDAGDKDSIARAIIEIAANQNVLDEMGTNCRSFLKSNHSVNHIADLILKSTDSDNQN